MGYSLGMLLVYNREWFVAVTEAGLPTPHRHGFRRVGATDLKTAYFESFFPFAGLSTTGAGGAAAGFVLTAG